MRQIEVRDETSDLLLERARGEGFGDLPAYLDSLANDGYVTEMTPELAAALEEGEEDIRQGRMFGEEVIREDMARLRRERAEKAA